MKPQRVANITLNASIAVLPKDPLTVLRKFVDAYGTSEGVKKAWDTRGRGRHQEAITPQGTGKVADIKSPEEIYKAYDQWNNWYEKFDPQGIGAGDPKNVQPSHAVGIMRDIVSSYENMERHGDDNGGFVKAEVMHDKSGNVLAAL